MSDPAPGATLGLWAAPNPLGLTCVEIIAVWGEVEAPMHPEPEHPNQWWCIVPDGAAGKPEFRRRYA